MQPRIHMRVCVHANIHTDPDIYTAIHWGFYFVCVMKVYSEVFFAKRYDFGCNFWDREETQVTPKIVSFSVSVLTVVTNNTETATSM